MTEKRPKGRRRRPLHVSLRAVLVAVLLVSTGLGWVAVRKERGRQQRAAVEAIRKLGGRVLRGEKDPRVPRWLRYLLGDDFFYRKVEIVGLKGTQITDGGLHHLQGLANLERLDLGCTPITDAGLEHLTVLTKLRYLNLRETQVTPEGMQKFQEALPECEIVY